MLSFIHLSDIHFSKYSSHQYSPDNDLRNELLLDIREHFVPMMKRENAKTTGVLVCGDIAYSAQEYEYVAAGEFLNELCDTLDIDLCNVFCVPGNHDVDWAIARKGSPVKFFQDELSSELSQQSFDRRIQDIIEEKKWADALFDPLSAYNTFVARYLSNFRLAEKGHSAAEALYWDFGLFPLDSSASINLRLRGLNSCVISNADDHPNGGAEGELERPMRMFSSQVPSREKGVVYMTLCHHPPECWQQWDGAEEDLVNKMNHRVAIQLYGHRHIHTIYTPTETSLIIQSGATQPPRGYSEWVPRYNWILLDLHSEAGEKYLNVQVFPRIYRPSENHFASDEETGAEEYSTYRVRIGDSWTAKGGSNGGLPMEEHEGMGNVSPPVPLLELKDDSLKIVWDFMTLNYVARSRILTDLGLTRDEDAGKQHEEYLLEILNRAREQGVIEDLRDRVSIAQRGDAGK